jgi:hypothetical protein
MRVRTVLSSKATAYTLNISVRVLLARVLATVPCRSIGASTLVAVPVLVAWAAACLASRIEHLALVIAHAALLVGIVVRILAAIGLWLDAGRSVPGCS